MGKYAGQVTGVLQAAGDGSPRRSCAGTATTRKSARKMQQWVKVGGYSLILWWAIIGGLHHDLPLLGRRPRLPARGLPARPGKVPSGVAVPIQMATIAQGVMGPMAGWLMLLFIMVTLYDAQFPFYDTYIGRTTCDAIAVTGRARRPYRFYYFVVVTAAVAGRLLPDHGRPAVHPVDRRRHLGAGLPLDRRLADPAAEQPPSAGRASRSARSTRGCSGSPSSPGFGGVGLWAVTVLPGEIAKRFGG